MNSKAWFPPKNTPFTRPGRAWRKVVSSKDKVLQRDHLDGSTTLVKVNELTLECGHVVTHPRRTLRPPDKVICKTCEKTKASA